MISYQRPPKPHGYPSKKIIAEQIKLANGAPIKDAKPHWQEHKSAFCASQHHKCGWCETPNAGDHGAVDHYAPKAEISFIATPGNELSDVCNVHGRTFGIIHTIGYVDLCYDWNNWIFSCRNCNSEWKRSLFPVFEDPHPDPISGGAYTPLLLNPFQDPDPEDHLDFDGTGQIKPRARSLRGKETIQALGLDRESLRRQREDTMLVASNAMKSFQVLALKGGDEDELHSALELLAKLAHPASRYAAVARALIRKELECSWRELAEICGSPRTPA